VDSSYNNYRIGYSWRKNIMVVDDNALLLRNMHVLLKDQYNVILVKNGMEAINKVMEKKPDLILLDYEMPDMSGAEVYRFFRADENTKDIPIVFLTSVADAQVVSELLSLKPEAYLLKPTEKGKLFSTIEDVLQRRK